MLSSQNQLSELRSELTGESRERLISSAAKERVERRGLLSTSSTSSAATPEAVAARHQAAVQRTEESMQQQQQIQHSEVEVQDEQLGVLSGVMDRLGNMGRSINEELRSQGRALDEFSQVKGSVSSPTSCRLQPLPNTPLTLRCLSSGRCCICCRKSTRLRVE